MSYFPHQSTHPLLLTTIFLLPTPDKPQWRCKKPEIIMATVPNWNQMTVYDSFQHEVLLLTKAPSNLRVPSIDINKKGQSTQAAVPPKIWFPKDIKIYNDYANNVLQAQRTALSGTYLPAPYNTCVLNSEADIVQASVLWLIHPVIVALQAHYPDTSCAAEVTIDDCRCDALISIGNRPLVVIEYKNRGNLKKADFDRGRVDDCSEQNKAFINQKIGEAQAKRLGSCMADDATCLTKQAAAYATKWKTRHVVLFDWDGMFLWNFAGFNPLTPMPQRGSTAKPVAGHAEWAYGTWVQRRCEYRKALLGFVMEALRDKSRQGWEKNGARAPWVPSPAEKERRRVALEAARLAKMSEEERKKEKENAFKSRRP